MGGSQHCNYVSFNDSRDVSAGGWSTVTGQQVSRNSKQYFAGMHAYRLWTSHYKYQKYYIEQNLHVQSNLRFIFYLKW